MKQIITFFTNPEKLNPVNDLTVGQLHFAIVGMAIIATVMVVTLIKKAKSAQAEF